MLSRLQIVRFYKIVIILFHILYLPTDLDLLDTNVRTYFPIGYY